MTGGLDGDPLTRRRNGGDDDDDDDDGDDGAVSATKNWERTALALGTHADAFDDTLYEDSEEEAMAHARRKAHRRGKWEECGGFEGARRETDEVWGVDARRERRARGDATRGGG
jgi:hypothetical protein